MWVQSLAFSECLGGFLVLIRKKHFFLGPQLPQRCQHGSMVTLPFVKEALLVGCSDTEDGSTATGNIIK